MTRDAIPWIAPPGTLQRNNQIASAQAAAMGMGGHEALPAGHIPWQAPGQTHMGGTAHLLHVGQQRPPPPVAAPMPAAAGNSAPSGVKICPECGGHPGNHRKGCAMEGSVFDRVKKKPAAAAAAAPPPADLGHATFQQARAQDASIPVGDMEVVDEVTGERQKRVPQVCNASYNLNPILRTQILDSDYFKSLVALTTFDDVVDEVYSKVTYATPFIPSTRSPSSCFCLLYKIFTMQPTYQQVRALLHHADSPYIKIVGILYVRFVVDPREMWDFFEEMMTDKTPVEPGGDGRAKTICQFVKDVIEQLHYFDTILPRIPVPVQRNMAELLLKNEEALNRVEMLKTKLKPGRRVRARFYEDDVEYEAEVLREGKNGMYRVVFTEYGNEQDTAIEDIV
eukprot:CAMPEP_0206237278 /NCGR_PEP_ID=MMETSP0047_2-20121206/14180_1 /ASSEMBLY_ACC=CAM_ASM_000192 /TAXON_ID=195065 /ORGANISM="Chroomonas mesostigmatica_cf, Strain CCMP1168" /LENGTH=394 /DNA_ID=CAMNT_0053661703 /DNA_START=306 /DNA_END=1485 /DNA_ORIENTATION=-